MTNIELQTMTVIKTTLPKIAKELERIANSLESKSDKCCICGCDIIGNGNNAYPIADGRCCDKCNIEKVLPERAKLLKEIH